MKTNDVFPSRFLKAGDLNDDTLVTIKLVAIEVMNRADGTEDDKPVVYFNEFGKGLVLNKTNWRAIVELCGDESDGWIGEKVVLTTIRIDAFGKAVDVIRVVKSVRGAKPAPDEMNRSLGATEAPA
jgi:hypothetical protein